MYYYAHQLLSKGSEGSLMERYWPALLLAYMAFVIILICMRMAIYYSEKETNNDSTQEENDE